ncbi:ephrin type-B receptor 2 isoform X4 [Vespula pensylvanica]|uniref:ephrin type-B receptor 2 isoform X4 n=1 Tax=Vespula pensylvanica TaxID=30213 RepID=UPI001CB9EA9B|nr:ephrin type-B receptor 2 isoform X4 [Vespula pensylvanica]
MAPFFAASTLAGALRPLLALLLALLIGCPRAIHAEQVVLLDTTTEAKLEWTRYPYGPQASTPGWVEESFTNFDKGINWRSYVVCDVAYNNVNNWLWTPFIERGPANRMYIEIKFTTRDCSLFPGNALSCKETFSLLYYEFDAATKEPPPWEPDSYKLIGRIAAGEGRFNTNTEVVINTEIKSVPVTKKGVYFAFRDQGACISLLAIKVYYISCPEISVNFAHFPATPTGREVALVEQTIGTCVANAVKIETPTFLCKGDGKWYLPSGGCHCKPGYQADVEKQQCIECPIGRFKHEAGPHSCELCPTHSKSTDQAVTECRCDADYYRAADDPKKMPCTQPPSAPQNLTVNFVDQSTVILSWNAPHKLGGRTDTTYRVVCDACSMGVKYIPNTEIFNDTKITITGLNAVTTYRFQVFAENGVSAQAGKSEYVDITVTTEASVPSLVSNVRITSVKSSELSISWDAPVTEVGGDSDHVERYEVRCYPRFDDAINATVIQTSDLSATFKGLKPATDYAIQVRAKTTRGWGEYTPVIYKKTPHAMGLDYVGEDDNMQVRIIAGAVVAVVVLLVIIIVMTVLFLRRNPLHLNPYASLDSTHIMQFRCSRASDECNKKQPSDCDTLEYRNGEGLVVTYMHCKMDSSPIVTTHTNNKSKSSLGVTGAGAGGTGGTGARSYVDPHTYEDPNQAVREFAREIDAGYITIEAIIGGGEFGDVCRGKLKLPPDGRTEIDVAIKTLKPGSADKARNDFLTEASIMGQFEHPNVIFLQGVVTKSNPVMIITEFMENGSLDTFLRANDGKFQVLQLVGMLRGIASGMQYLAEMNYVHRDLAARNVLVNAALVCKIADFGLSREIESATEGAYTTRGGKIPVRWTAPEAIAFRKFTSASDVWSMGIVCWEVMSYGERPYWNWSNQDVIKSIEKGYRLPAPMDCPEAIYQLMLDCWQKERTHRPTFANLTQTLDKLIRSPDTLRKIAQNRIRERGAPPPPPPATSASSNVHLRKRGTNPLAPDAVDLTQLTSVSEWLASIKMSRYAESFERAGVTTLEAAARVTVQELTALGITLVGHQKKIMNSVTALRAQMSATSQSFLV